jgi:phage terminase Nu1 subunit (DNA packaging protein)
MITVTTKEACDFFGVVKSTLTEWKKAGAPGSAGRNRWELKPLFDWWQENIVDTGRDASDTSLAEAKRRYWAARAEREQLRVDEQRGQLMSQDQIVKEWAWRMGEVTSGLQALSRKLSTLLDGKNKQEQQRIIDDEVWKLRDNYCRGGKFCPVEDSQDEKPVAQG